MPLELAGRMGVPADEFKLDFFGGTMFWVRPEALKPLRDLHLAADGLIDGDLPHPVERSLPTSVLAARYRLADTDGCRLPTRGGEPNCTVWSVGMGARGANWVRSAKFEVLLN